MLDSRQRNELDRHITGNYGEDRFKGGGENCQLCDDPCDEDDTCPNCGPMKPYNVVITVNARNEDHARDQAINGYGDVTVQEA